MTKKARRSHLCALAGCGNERRRNGKYCSVECRFWSKYDRSAGPDGCWLWTGSIDKKTGYGTVDAILAGGNRTNAHRRAFTLTHGTPGKMSVLHRCDTPLCGQPAHLFLGTPRTNWLDSVAKGRQTVIVPGEANAKAKLTPAEVLAIRRSAARVSDLVRQYGVHDSTIRRIRRREIWRHVPNIRIDGDPSEWVFMTGVMNRPAPMLDQTAT